MKAIEGKQFAHVEAGPEPLLGLITLDLLSTTHSLQPQHPRGGQLVDFRFLPTCLTLEFSTQK